MSLRRVLGVLAAGLALTLAACSSSDHNDADVAFAQQMIPHHQQAVEMSDMALQKAANPDVRRLATAIRGEQAPEIEQMTGFLQEWGAPMPDGSMMMSMPGMADMGALAAATGPAFDRLWLQDMIAHHLGAVQMADQELAQGGDDDARELAEQIREAQLGEIEEMRGVLPGLS